MECINSLIGHAVVSSRHPDLMQSVITPNLVSHAADALADLFLSKGFHLAYGHVDGLLISQTYHSLASHERIEGFEFTLLQVTQRDTQWAMALAVRTTPSGAFSNSRKDQVFSGAIRIAGEWFSTLRAGVDADTLIRALLDPPIPKSLHMHKFLAGGLTTPTRSHLGGIGA